jgi:hypothetical protein
VYAIRPPNLNLLNVVTLTLNEESELLMMQIPPSSYIPGASLFLGPSLKSDNHKKHQVKSWF